LKTLLSVHPGEATRPEVLGAADAIVSIALAYEPTDSE
jgi:hypothetical protein